MLITAYSRVQSILKDVLTASSLQMGPQSSLEEMEFPFGMNQWLESVKFTTRECHTEIISSWLLPTNSAR